MIDAEISQQGIAHNTFGENSLFAINRNTFTKSDASSVFRAYYGESLFKEDTFYVVAGTDSSLLYQYVKTKGVPKGSRYLFVELPQVLTFMESMEGIPKKLVIATGENWLSQANEMEMVNYALLDRLVLLRSLGVIHGHYSDYPPFWRKLKSEFDTFRWDQQVSLSNRPFLICQIENLTENLLPAIHLRNSFVGKTAVILSGGPSLDNLLPWVKQHRNNLLVIAVSRISHSLFQAGIQPDICVSVDPQPLNLKVSQDMLRFQDKTLLINEYHLSSNLLASWGGQKAYTGPRYPWPTPLQPENLPPTGGATVTTSAYAIAVETGVSQIILGGADFCFNQQGYTHASGSTEHAMGSMPQLCDQQVETNNGKIADTLNAYHQTAQYVDLMAKHALSRNCRTINPAPEAMRLPHVEFFPAEDIQIEPLEIPAREQLTKHLPVLDSRTRIKIYNEILTEVDRVLTEIEAITELSRKALKYNHAVIIKEGQDTEVSSTSNKINIANANKIDHIDEQIIGKYTDTVNFLKQYGVKRLVPLLGFEIDNLEALVNNNQIHFQALKDTGKELIDILRKSRSRIMCRLEEEKPHPSVKRLLDQWSRDKQPGRAIQWAQQHPDVIRQLPQTQQEALRAFQDTLPEILEDLERTYVKRIEWGNKLEGIPARAREYFHCHDKEGLSRLLSGLQTYRDKNQAGDIIPLLQGYYDELRGNPNQAIVAYQRISGGPAHIDALMRLFELFSNKEDWDNALQTLKSLSDINANYSPMYADLLYSCNDIDTAVNIYTDYLLNNPDDLNSMMKLGNIFLQCGSAEGVEWTMNYILDKDPNNMQAKQILTNFRQSIASN